MKTNINALIVEGGAMRSVFSAGLLDGFLAKQFNPFDFYIGVSAGAFNLTNYVAGLSGRSLQVFQQLATDRQFMNYWRFLRGGHLLDLDWLFAAVTTALPWDPAQGPELERPIYIGVTDVMSGNARYVAASAANLEQAMKASAALPLLYRGFPRLDQRPLTDGGVADGIPVAEAIRLGATRIMVIRSRARTYRKRDTLGHKWIRWKLRRYQALQQTLRERVTRFEAALQLMRRPPAGVHILEICPPEDLTIGRFNRNPRQLQTGYDAGLAQAQTAIQQWHSS
jgi:predicted patatin/cPLA2 family phospholipase